MKTNDRNQPGFWTDEIDRAWRKRERIAASYEWKKIRDLWNSGSVGIGTVTAGDKSAPFAGTESTFVNWVWAFCQTFIPAVYWRHPRVHVYPSRHTFLANARFVEPMINVAFERTKFRKALLRALQDVCVFGHGWMKMGWFTRFGQVPPGVLATDALKEGRTSELDTETYLQYDAPYAYRVSPDRIYVDPEASCYEEVRWIGQEYFRPLEDVKKDPFLKYTDDISSLLFKEPGDQTLLPDNKTETKAKWARLFEIWDRDDNRVMVICEGSDRINREIHPWPYQGLSGFPFKYLQVTEAIDEFYPPSPVLPWLPLVEELSFLRSMRMDAIKRMVNKYGARQDALTDEQMRDFLDPDQEVFRANDPDGIKEFKGLVPDPNLYASEDKVKEDIREISGFSEILSGSVPYSRIAATTSAIMERNATLRFDHYSERVAEFIKDCAVDLFKIVRQHTTYPEVVQLTGEPNPQWMELSRAEVEGEFYFTIDLEDMAVASKQQKIKESFDAMSALAQFPQVKVDSLIKDLLIAFGKSDIDNYLNPPAGPPLDPQWENEQLVRGVPVEPNMMEDFQTHLMVHEGFMRSPEYMKAIQLLPQIAALFSEHLQKTLRLSEAAAQANPRPKPNSSLQTGGGALAGSRPFGGAQNQAGPAGSALGQAAQRFM